MSAQYQNNQRARIQFQELRRCAGFNQPWRGCFLQHYRSNVYEMLTSAITIQACLDQVIAGKMFYIEFNNYGLFYYE